MQDRQEYRAGRAGPLSTRTRERETRRERPQPAQRPPAGTTPGQARSALCLDLGGGGLEVVVGDPVRLRFARTLPLGVVGLSVELVRGDPPSAEDERRLRERVIAVLGPVTGQVAALAPDVALGTGGTLCALARMVAARRLDPPPASPDRLTIRREEVLAVHRSVMAAPSAGRALLPGLDARRAELMPAGSTVLLTAMELLGLTEITIREGALREGMIDEAIQLDDAGGPDGDPEALRRASVTALGRRFGWDEAHSRQVARLALALFDATASLHRLEPADRELLEHAALLHDIGQHVAAESHHKHTAYLIQNARLDGFDREEVAALAALARYHRRSEPRDTHEPFASLSPERRERVTRLAGLLRVADGLDYGHTGAVEALEVTIVRGAVRIGLRPQGDLELALWGARRKRTLLERVLGKRVDVIGPASEIAESDLPTAA
jgi:exopolyphosphatase/guanosine-5'-triphosphate,3'-diphosphate pyrophosphatase